VNIVCGKQAKKYTNKRVYFLLGDQRGLNADFPSLKIWLEIKLMGCGE